MGQIGFLICSGVTKLCKVAIHCDSETHTQRTTRNSYNCYEMFNYLSPYSKCIFKKAVLLKCM
jgi:hypothetical protein